MGVGGHAALAATAALSAARTERLDSDRAIRSANGATTRAPKVESVITSSHWTGPIERICWTRRLRPSCWLPPTAKAARLRAMPNARAAECFAIIFLMAVTSIRAGQFSPRYENK